ncbi:MAG: hypothetical protein U0667_03755 [Chloroflexota bacterium]
MPTLVDGDAPMAQARELLAHAIPHPRVGRQPMHQERRDTGRDVGRGVADDDGELGAVPRGDALTFGFRDGHVPQG